MDGGLLGRPADLNLTHVEHTSLCVSGCNRQTRCSGTLRWNRATVGQELAEVVEKDHAVAQEAPSLLGMGHDRVGSISVRAVRGRARRSMWAHCAPLELQVLGLLLLRRGHDSGLACAICTTPQASRTHRSSTRPLPVVILRPERRRFGSGASRRRRRPALEWCRCLRSRAGPRRSGSPEAATDRDRAGVRRSGCPPGGGSYAPVGCHRSCRRC